MIFNRVGHSEGCKKGRASNGARVAEVDRLRAIRVTGEPDAQVVFAYDDPIDEINDQHAVLRVREDVERSNWNDIRDKIKKEFSRMVPP